MEQIPPDEVRWLDEEERRWREANAIAERYGVDAGGVYHVLRNLNLEKTPSQRLRDALQRGKVFGISRPVSALFSRRCIDAASGSCS